MFSLSPTHPRCSVSLGDMATSLGTATHSALSCRCSCGHGEGHLFGAGFNVLLIVSLSRVTIHHTKCPHRLMPRAGADGETQHLCLALQSLAQSLARSLAGGIGSWLPAPGNGVWNGTVPVQSLRDEPVGPAPACRSQGFGEQGELREWIFCRAQTCPVSPVAQVRTGLFPSSGMRGRCSSALFAVAVVLPWGWLCPCSPGSPRQRLRSSLWQWGPWVLGF